MQALSYACPAQGLEMSGSQVSGVLSHNNEGVSIMQDVGVTRRASCAGRALSRAATLGCVSFGLCSYLR